jgi:hypothetical protein
MNVQTRPWTAAAIAAVVTAGLSSAVGWIGGQPPPPWLGLGRAVQAAQAPPASSPTRRHVETLASEKLEGRLTGSAGERLAGDYIVSELQRAGARPLPGLPDFRVPFEFTAGSRDGGSAATVRVPATGALRTFDRQSDVRALAFSDNAEVSGPVIFAGYGIVTPDSQSFAYDSYMGLDVRDKVVLILRYFPEDADPRTKAALVNYSDLRYKAMAARQRGAKALLVVTGPRSPNAGETIPMSFDTALAGSGIAAASISADVASAMFGVVPDKTLDVVQLGFDSGNPHVAGFDLPGVTVTLRVAVVRERQTGRNILAYLPATSAGGQPEKPWVVLGAHYDHLGHGTNGNSLAHKDEAGRIHYGADDNASGTAAVLAIGEHLGTQPRRRNVLLAFWSGEEIGLVGSSAFAARPPIPIDQFAAYLNFDMVGRMQDNKLTVQAAGTSPVWPTLIEQANVLAGFDLQLQPDPYQPTDVATFTQAGVPSLNFFTGSHVDYHRPTDTADRIDYEDLDRVAAFGSAIARRLLDRDEAPAFTKVDRPAPGAGRAGVRVFTGTIPDYTSEAQGLLLSGVIGGGPADQAGLQKGDLVVELAGRSITNIYDYTYALEVLKIGQPVKVVYVRDGTRRETTLIPAARR